MRLHRRVSDVAVVIRHVERLRTRLAAEGEVTGGIRRGRCRRGLHQVREDALGIDRWRWHVKLGVDQLQRGVRGLRIGGEHRHEPILIHDRHPGQQLGRVRVHSDEPSPMRRRPKDAGVQHAGQADIPSVLRGTGHLVVAIQPSRRLTDRGEVLHRAEHGTFIDRVRDLLPFGQLAVGHTPRLVATDGNDTVLHREGFVRDAKARGGQIGQHQTRLGRRSPHRRSEHAGGERAERAHVPRTRRGVAHHDVDRLERHTQFFGGHLGQRRYDPLPHLDLARVERDGAVFGDMEVRIDVRGVAALRARWHPRVQNHVERQRHDHDDPAPHELHEFASVHPCCVSHRGLPSGSRRSRWPGRFGYAPRTGTGSAPCPRRCHRVTGSDSGAEARRHS